MRRSHCPLQPSTMKFTFKTHKEPSPHRAATNAGTSNPNTELGGRHCSGFFKRNQRPPSSGVEWRAGAHVATTLGEPFLPRAAYYVGGLSWSSGSYVGLLCGSLQSVHHNRPRRWGVASFRNLWGIAWDLSGWARLFGRASHITPTRCGVCVNFPHVNIKLRH